MSLFISNLALILVNRSKTGNLIDILTHNNKAFNWIGGGALVLLILVLVIPSIRALFAFELVQTMDLVLALVVASLSLILVNAVRMKDRNY